LRRIYKQLRRRLPLKGQSGLTKLIWSVSGKPYVLPGTVLKLEKQFPNNARGGMIISADFEGAWAYRYAKKAVDPYKYAVEMAKRERVNIPLLLALFEKYTIPITWATVGHLFLYSCHSDTHKWMSKMPHFENRGWRFEEGDWFQHDPYSNYKEDPEWYAPDLIQKIIDSAVNHELASHTFSHVDFSDEICPKEVAQDEIKACLKVMNDFGIKKPTSICFPAGTWGNVSVLKSNGIKIYRRKFNNYQLAYPFFDNHGLLVTISSGTFDRTFEFWSAAYYQSLARKIIDKAIKTGTVAHFVFHPAMDSWMIPHVMDEVLKYAISRRNSGDLWIGTMSEMAHHINNSFHLIPSPEL
jgi:peptidoglycan/xylan/chitin deacetylase (PgdA/CDA1 family)